MHIVSRHRHVCTFVLDHRSDTYSSTNPSVNGFAAALADGSKSVRTSFPGVELSPTSDSSQDVPTTNVKGGRTVTSRQSTGRDVSSRHPGDNATIGHRGSATDDALDGMGSVDQDMIPRSDWNKTLDTAVSIPEGPEERADEHEANASLGTGNTYDDDIANVKDER